MAPSHTLSFFGHLGPTLRKAWITPLKYRIDGCKLVLEKPRMLMCSGTWYLENSLQSALRAVKVPARFMGVARQVSRSESVAARGRGVHG